MYIEKRHVTSQEQKRIAHITTISLTLLFGFLLLSFWTIQILRGHEYAEKAQRNIHDSLTLKAPRGIIEDRYGHIIASNRLNFSLFFRQERLPDIHKIPETHLSQIGFSRSELTKLIDHYADRGSRGLIPVKRNLQMKHVIYLESRPELLAYFQIEIEPARSYPYGASGSHILGFMGEISKRELERMGNSVYGMGDMVGKSGLEKQYEGFLKGQKGRKDVIKDNTGTIQKVTSISPPVIGSTVVTTIDFSIQEQVEQMFQGQIGTIAVLDLKSGGLVCLVSQPNFDPDALSGIITTDFWESILNDPRRPLQNRFSQGLYSPGSVFKLVVSLAGLSEHTITPATRVMCTGSVLIYDRPFSCWQSSGHGLVNLAEAIKGSCNVYFYQLGKKLDVDQIAFYAGQLGLGKPSNIDLPNEKTGIIPTKSWKEREKKQPWFPGETISVSIGGGWVSVTPVQVLRMVSIVARRGIDSEIHLVEKIRNGDRIVQSFQHSPSRCSIETQLFEPVIEGMWRAVNDGGTARRAAIEGLDICGKTGTQQIISKENPNYAVLTKQPRFRPHSWFASFAPRNNPRYAVVVLVENGGEAGQIAVPFAEQIYRLLFNRQKNA